MPRILVAQFIVRPNRRPCADAGFFHAQTAVALDHTLAIAFIHEHHGGAARAALAHVCVRINHNGIGNRPALQSLCDDGILRLVCRILRRKFGQAQQPLQVSAGNGAALFLAEFGIIHISARRTDALLQRFRAEQQAFMANAPHAIALIVGEFEIQIRKAISQWKKHAGGFPAHAVQQERQAGEIFANPCDFLPFDLHSRAIFAAIDKQQYLLFLHGLEEFTQGAAINCVFVDARKDFQRVHTLPFHFWQQVVRMRKLAGVMRERHPAGIESRKFAAFSKHEGIADFRMDFFGLMRIHQSAVHATALHLVEQLRGGPWRLRIFSRAPANGSEAVEVTNVGGGHGSELIRGFESRFMELFITAFGSWSL
ncbi:hypothetical protein DCC62_24290 [candidate division KSB1 bacterium]|nr:MAG: hypothetical protein DCC62_24290 [candidate division KSB1 bacterium]